MRGKGVKHCSLCFHNGEPEDYYRCYFPFFVVRGWPIILTYQVVRVAVFYLILTFSALTTWRLAMEKSWLVQFFASLSATSVVLLAIWLTLWGWLCSCWSWDRFSKANCFLRYCPFNKDGAFSRGASLPLLKTKKNAAGNFSNRRLYMLELFLESDCQRLTQDDLPPPAV